MWFFKKSDVRPIPANEIWNHLAHDHLVPSDKLLSYMRCILKDGVREGKKVSLVRVFDLQQAKQRNIDITTWESLDQHPELIAFEGYYTDDDHAFLERKGG